LHRPPDGRLGHQQARNLAWALHEGDQPVRDLIHDRDAKFPPAFDTALSS